MKALFLILSIFICTSLMAQSEDNVLQGNVSYVGNQNVYVSFVNTEGIKVGDSLYVIKENRWRGVLLVKDLSSISCVCTPIGLNTFSATNMVFAKKVLEKPVEIELQKQLEAVAVNDQAIKAVGKKDVNHDQDSKLNGRLSISSYSNITDNTPSYNVDSVNKMVATHRLRYNLELNAEHISNSKVSFASNLSFTNQLNHPSDQNDGLRIYDLALKYDYSKTLTLQAGRSINPQMANIGAVDGFQFEKSIQNFSYGALVGTRPNDVNYGYDPRLMEFGGFVGHHYENEKGRYSQTSFAFFNQTNNLVTDRRYLYFQHSNNLLKHVDFFCSFEADLYKLETIHLGYTTDSIPRGILAYQPKTVFDLTGVYASVRYKPWKQLSLSMIYDARNNVYFYETFKNTFNGNFDKMTRQGWKLQATVLPFNNLIWGSSAGYRLNPGDGSASMNTHNYLTYTNIPFINTAITIGATTLKTYTMNSSMYDISLSRDIINGKLFADIQYSMVNYVYNNTNTSTTKPIIFENTSLFQNVATLSLNWRLTNKLMLSADFEGTLDADHKYGLMMLNITQRF